MGGSWVVAVAGMLATVVEVCYAGELEVGKVGSGSNYSAIVKGANSRYNGHVSCCIGGCYKEKSGRSQNRQGTNLDGLVAASLAPGQSRRESTEAPEVGGDTVYASRTVRR